MEEHEIKEMVRRKYAEIARQNQQGCCSRCGCGTSLLAQARFVGYSSEDLESIPEEAIMGLGCGNPVAFADVQPGEVVLDLGSGTGVDVFLAANKVGHAGKAIGIDMTGEMINKAKRIARSHGYHNVEFCLGEMEALPVGDNSVDVIISNCVVNLCADKSRVFREAFRVLKPGGKLVISDFVSDEVLPAGIRNDPDAWACCIGGAMEQKEYVSMIEKAGFEDVQVRLNWGYQVENEPCEAKVTLWSVTVKARKR
jgi:arsenite methyltransferase